ncbi:hypothetical protein CEXT_285651 [Caerostris extrusa]|uniref:Uncharacterized protein n=1 Tax=Caerostris extrusa TaxID=172846 RepID=A0AAV4XET2_CAEEX|nr:hypothetical protein CEXT_285651 [Caerostris extrusa]
MNSMGCLKANYVVRAMAKLCGLEFGRTDSIRERSEIDLFHRRQNDPVRRRGMPSPRYLMRPSSPANIRSGRASSIKRLDCSAALKRTMFLSFKLTKSVRCIPPSQTGGIQTLKNGLVFLHEPTSVMLALKEWLGLSNC